MCQRFRRELQPCLASRLWACRGAGQRGGRDSESRDLKREMRRNGENKNGHLVPLAASEAAGLYRFVFLLWARSCGPVGSELAPSLHNSMKEPLVGFI